MRSDAALAERVTGGDEAAFDVLYERHRAVVLAVAMGVLGTMHDAEDATQETFSALAIALRTKPPAELRPWLIRVARNAAIDTTRRRRHRLLTLDGEIPEAQARPTGGGKAELAVVFDGIRELPEGQRMALLMRELGGHTYAEIADFLETDEEAVKGLIARARVGLRAFREASELPCASARSTIAAEPDGRRYDRTIRRHLRGCASCRSYRDALRDDAKALRACLPLQAGGVAAGTGIGAGPLAAAKGAMVGYSLTQAAATCAASACAVGAVGGMVLISPFHRFGLPTILPDAKHAKAHKPEAKPVTAHTHVRVSTHPRLTLHASDVAVTRSRAKPSDAAPHTTTLSLAVAALRPVHGHQRVAVKHSTPHVTALPTISTPTTTTTSTTTLTSSPASTPAPSQPVTQSTQAPGQTTTATSTGTSSASQSTGASPSPTQESGSSAGATSTTPSGTEPSGTTTTTSSAASDAIASRAVQAATETIPSPTPTTGSSTTSGGSESPWSGSGWYPPGTGTGTTGTVPPDPSTGTTTSPTPSQGTGTTTPPTPSQGSGTAIPVPPDQNTATTGSDTQTSSATPTTSTTSTNTTAPDGTAAGTATDATGTATDATPSAAS